MFFFSRRVTGHDPTRGPVQANKFLTSRGSNRVGSGGFTGQIWSVRRLSSITGGIRSGRVTPIGPDPREATRPASNPVFYCCSKRIHGVEVCFHIMQGGSPLERRGGGREEA